MPLYWNKASALAIIDTILDNQRSLTLNIQSELSSGRLELHETAAGKIVYENYYKLKQNLEKQLNNSTIELDTAIREHHDRRQMESREEIDVLRHHVSAKSAGLDALRVDGNQLVSTWMQTIAKEVGALKAIVDDVEQVRLQAAENDQEQDQSETITWVHPEYEALIRARQEGKLSGCSFIRPDQLGTAAGIAGALFGAGSLLTGAGSLEAGVGSLAISTQTSGGAVGTAAAVAALCNVM